MLIKISFDDANRTRLKMIRCLPDLQSLIGQMSTSGMATGLMLVDLFSVMDQSGQSKEDFL